MDYFPPYHHYIMEMRRLDFFMTAFSTTAPTKIYQKPQRIINDPSSRVAERIWAARLLSVGCIGYGKELNE